MPWWGWLLTGFGVWFAGIFTLILVINLRTAGRVVRSINEEFHQPSLNLGPRRSDRRPLV